MTSRWGRVLKKTVRHGFCFLPRSIFSVEKPSFSQPSCSPLLRPVSAFGSVSRGIKLLCPLPCHLWELTSPFLAVLLLVWPVCLLPLSVGKGFCLCTWICLPLEALLFLGACFSSHLSHLCLAPTLPDRFSSSPAHAQPGVWQGTGEGVCGQEVTAPQFSTLAVVGQFPSWEEKALCPPLQALEGSGWWDSLPTAAPPPPHIIVTRSAPHLIFTVSL